MVGIDSVMNEHASALGKLGAEARWGKKILDTGTPDLFGYPNASGFKRNGTSAEAAQAIRPRVPCLRRQCLVRLKEKPSTADEVAERLNKSILSIRPRLSELVALGVIEETGRRRRNASGTMAAEWRVKTSVPDVWEINLEVKK